MATGNKHIADQVYLSQNALDKGLRPDLSEQYSLSIQLSPDGFSFCIFDASRNKYAGLMAYNFPSASPLLLNQIVGSIVKQNQWLNLNYQQCSLIYETAVTTLVPNSLFDESKIREYLKLNHHIAESDLVKHDYLPLPDAENIWAIPTDVVTMLNIHFPNARVFNHTSTLIESLLLQNKNREAEEAVFVNIRKSTFDIVILKGNHLLFSNAFQYRTKEDFIYYLIYVLEQLHLNPEKIGLTLMGEIVRISEIYEVTYKYVRNIAFAARNTDYQFSYVFDEIPNHIYFNLINIQQCGL